MRWRGGFSLVEVLVVVAVGSLTMHVALQVVTAVSSAATLGIRMAKAHEARMLTLRRLSRLLASAEPPRDSTPFVGRFDSLDLRGSHVGASAGHAAGALHLALNDGALLVSTREGHDVLRVPADSVAIEYLAARGRAAPFLSEWASTTALPLAVRLRLWHRLSASHVLVDTLLVALGDS